MNMHNIPHGCLLPQNISEKLFPLESRKFISLLLVSVIQVGSSLGYASHSYLQGITYKSCLHNFLDMIQKLEAMGHLHPDKSIFIVRLGFIISSTNKTLSLTDE